jgi:hypothetical protein
MWMKMATCIRKSGLIETKETWWWNENVQKTIKEKKECFTCMYLDMNAHNIEQYKLAKKTAKRAAGEARGQMYDRLY